MGGRRGGGGRGSSGLWLACAVSLTTAIASCAEPDLPDDTAVDLARAIGGVPPGDPVYDAGLTGPGACAGNTLAGVIAQVHAGWPQLGDVQRVYQPRAGRIGGDGSYVYAFAGASGFALVFRRGGGDCPAGCTENEYWYFVTDDTCTARQVGHYRAAWATGTCLSAAGAPLWGLPSPPDPVVVCRTENHPQP
jgi:hypothetical protein